MIQNFLFYVLHLILYHFMLALLLPGIAFMTYAILQYKKIVKVWPGPYWFKRIKIGFAILLANCFLGSIMDETLIYYLGDQGLARLDNSYYIGGFFNNRPVKRYDITLKTKEGKYLQTYFDNYDVNTFPWTVKFPPPATKPFPVRYIRHFPFAFIITDQ